MASISIANLTDITQQLININKQLSQLFSQLAAIAIIPPGTASQGGTNTFTGVNTFRPPPFIGAGGGGGQFFPSGMLSNQFSVLGIGNGADTTDDTLFSYSLPANSLDAVGRSVVIESYGKFATNAHNKTVKLWLGATLVFTSALQMGSNVGWWMRLSVVKTGADAQLGIGFGAAGIVTFAVPVPLAGSEVDTNAITLRVTGASPTTGAAGDVVANSFSVAFFN